MSSEAIRRLKEAIRRDREVEVDPTGRVREVPPEPEKEKAKPPRKPTKLAPRTFGAQRVVSIRHRERGSLERALLSGRRLRIFLPSASADSLSDSALSLIEGLLLPITGGLTAFDATGFWRNSDESTMREPVRVIDAHLPQHLSGQIAARIVRALRRVRYLTRQDVLAVAVDDRIFFASNAGVSTNPHAHILRVPA